MTHTCRRVASSPHARATHDTPVSKLTEEKCPTIRVEKRSTLCALVLKRRHGFRLKTDAATVRVNRDGVVHRVSLPDEPRPRAVGQRDFVPTTLLPVDEEDRYERCGRKLESVRRFDE